MKVATATTKLEAESTSPATVVWFGRGRRKEGVSLHFHLFLPRSAFSHFTLCSALLTMAGEGEGEEGKNCSGCCSSWFSS